MLSNSFKVTLNDLRRNLRAFHFNRRKFLLTFHFYFRFRLSNLNFHLYFNRSDFHFYVYLAFCLLNRYIHVRSNLLFNCFNEGGLVHFRNLFRFTNFHFFCFALYIFLYNRSNDLYPNLYFANFSENFHLNGFRFHVTFNGLFNDIVLPSNQFLLYFHLLCFRVKLRLYHATFLFNAHLFLIRLRENTNFNSA